jgi:hypothetical protein
MFQIDEEYMKELGYDDLPDEEKSERMTDVEGAIAGRLIRKVEPLVPNFEELFNETKKEFKQDIEKFRTSKPDKS